MPATKVLNSSRSDPPEYVSGCANFTAFTRTDFSGSISPAFVRVVWIISVIQSYSSCKPLIWFGMPWSLVSATNLSQWLCISAISLHANTYGGVGTLWVSPVRFASVRGCLILHFPCLEFHSTFSSELCSAPLSLLGASEVKQLRYKHPGSVRHPWSAGLVGTKWWPWS